MEQYFLTGITTHADGLVTAHFQVERPDGGFPAAATEPTLEAAIKRLCGAEPFVNKITDPAQMELFNRLGGPQLLQGTKAPSEAQPQRLTGSQQRQAPPPSQTQAPDDPPTAQQQSIIPDSAYISGASGRLPRSAYRS